MFKKKITNQLHYQNALWGLSKEKRSGFCKIAFATWEQLTRLIRISILNLNTKNINNVQQAILYDKIIEVLYFQIWECIWQPILESVS
jgi:hypothetical protein